MTDVEIKDPVLDKSMGVKLWKRKWQMEKKNGQSWGHVWILLQREELAGIKARAGLPFRRLVGSIPSRPQIPCWGGWQRFPGCPRGPQEEDLAGDEWKAIVVLTSNRLIGCRAESGFAHEKNWCSGRWKAESVQDTSYTHWRDPGPRVEQLCSLFQHLGNSSGPVYCLLLLSYGCFSAHTLSNNNIQNKQGYIPEQKSIHLGCLQKKPLYVLTR